MKPLTKTVVSRGGGIAARFASYGPPTIDFGTGPQELDRLPQAGETIVVKPKTTTTDTVRITLKELTKLRKRGLLNDTVANTLLTVANKPRYARWREANPELYKERQAAYMRKRRAKEAGK